MGHEHNFMWTLPTDYNVISYYHGQSGPDNVLKLGEKGKRLTLKRSAGTGV